MKASPISTTSSRTAASPTRATRTTASTSKALAKKAVAQYAQYKTQKQTVGSLDIAKLPGVNHPVFKDKPVNHDPREVFIARLFEERGETNVFHAFYRALVQELFDAGVSRNVYCVNVDAVIAALLLKMLWKPLHAGEIGETRSGDSRLHDLPVPAHARLRRRDRRSPEPRPQHGYAHGRLGLQVRRLIGGARITNPGRNAYAFDVPTLKEQGYDVHAGGFRGFVAPAGVSREVVALWETTLSKVHKSAGWQDYMKSNMYEDLYMNAEEMTRWLVSEQADYARFLTEMGLVMKKEEKK
jgi:hypothetical protein